VVTLLVTLYAAVIGPYRNFKSTCLAMYAVVTPILIQITNTIFSLTDEQRAALPGANGSDNRPNLVAGSLIIVMVGAREATRCCSVKDPASTARQCHCNTGL
jgi:hypothetical protein